MRDFVKPWRRKAGEIMNRYESPRRPDEFIFGTLIVQVKDAATASLARKAYVGMNPDDPRKACRSCCGTHIAVTDADGSFSYVLPMGKWYLALSTTNWCQVWIPGDDLIEVTLIRNPGDQICRRSPEST